jgi:hypothetical protein
MLHANVTALTSFAGHILSGIGIGMISGIMVGLLTILSDAFFYSRYVSDFRLAKNYANPMIQLLVFMLINAVYAGIQGAILLWLLPILPSHWLLRGLVFGVASYAVLSRHFTEGFALMNPDYFPVHLSLYLSIEFLVIYVLQGILISIGMMMVSGI